MGHMLKNTKFKSGSYALGVPVGSSSIGPNSPDVGQTRYNQDTGKLEFYNNSVWNAVAKEGNVTIVRDAFTGNANITTYGPLSYSYSIGTGQETQVLVFLNTVYQIPGDNYDLTANIYNSALTDITFSSVTDSAKITVLHNLGSTTV